MLGWTFELGVALLNGRLVGLGLVNELLQIGFASLVALVPRQAQLLLLVQHRGKDRLLGWLQTAMVDEVGCALPLCCHAVTRRWRVLASRLQRSGRVGVMLH